MIARLYDPENQFILTCKAVYRLEDKIIYLMANEDLSNRGPDFIVHYSDDTQGIHDFRCTWAGCERDGALFYIALTVTETLQNVQRRMDVKAKLNLSIRLSLLETGNIAQTDPVSGKSIQFRAYLRDISAGGVMIDTEKDLDIGQKFAFPFDKGSNPVLLNAEVIRRQPDSGEFHRYGCKFYNSDDTKDAAVREYVFRLNLAARANPRDY